MLFELFIYSVPQSAEAIPFQGSASVMRNQVNNCWLSQVNSVVGEDVLGGLGHHLHTRVTFLWKKYILKSLRRKQNNLYQLNWFLLLHHQKGQCHHPLFGLKIFLLYFRFVFQICSVIYLVSRLCQLSSREYTSPSKSSAVLQQYNPCPKHRRELQSSSNKHGPS